MLVAFLLKETFYCLYKSFTLLFVIFLLVVWVVCAIFVGFFFFASTVLNANFSTLTCIHRQ